MCAAFVTVSAMWRLIAILFGLSLVSSSAWPDTYQTAETFLNESFAGSPPEASVLWLAGKVRETAKMILGHAPSQLRVRYWRSGQRSVWILDEIGKEQPITTGIVIDKDRIERVRVLEFRESRGWEVRHDFFTDQFKQIGLTQDLELDHRIDGISGATLSVRALTKQARLALFLNETIQDMHVAP